MHSTPEARNNDQKKLEDLKEWLGDLKNEHELVISINNEIELSFENYQAALRGPILRFLEDSKYSEEKKQALRNFAKEFSININENNVDNDGIDWQETTSWDQEATAETQETVTFPEYIDRFKEKFPSEVSVEQAHEIMLNSTSLADIQALGSVIQSMRDVLTSKATQEISTDQTKEFQEAQITKLQKENKQKVEDIINNNKLFEWLNLSEEQQEFLKNPVHTIAFLNLMLIEKKETYRQVTKLRGSIDYANLRTESSQRGIVEAFNRNESWYKDICKRLWSIDKTQQQSWQDVVEQYVHMMQPEWYAGNGKDKIKNIAFDWSEITYKLNGKKQTLSFSRKNFAEVMNNKPSNNIKNLYHIQTNWKIALNRSNLLSDLAQLERSSAYTKQTYHNVFEMLGDKVSSLSDYFWTMAANIFDALGSLLPAKWKWLFAYYKARQKKTIESGIQTLVDVWSDKIKHALRGMKVDDDSIHTLTATLNKWITASDVQQTLKNYNFSFKSWTPDFSPWSEKYFFATALDPAERILYLYGSATVKKAIVSSKVDDYQESWDKKNPDFANNSYRLQSTPESLWVVLSSAPVEDVEATHGTQEETKKDEGSESASEKA